MLDLVLFLNTRGKTCGFAACGGSRFLDCLLAVGLGFLATIVDKTDSV